MLPKPNTPKFLAIAAVALTTIGATAQATPQIQTSARPTARITQKIDASITTPLPGTHPSIVEHATVGARLAASTQLSHMMLLLSPTDDQEYALQTLLDQQQDKTSPNYHQWLTPESFGQTFGVAPADIAAVTAWLQDQGFHVDSVAKSNRIITFSGNVGQVETTFHTQMNALTVNGEAHISNTTDIAIPQALAGVVKGIASLNNFFPKAANTGARKIQINHSANLVTDSYFANPNPLFSDASTGAHFVTPGDAAIIFNSTPLLNAGIDGTGQTITVIGETDITLADVEQFRSMFGLKKNDPTFTVIGEDPGITSDDLEAYLDVEWAGGMAPGANINLIISGPDYVTTGGVDEASVYAVENNLGDIITLSYINCEAETGAGTASFYNAIWLQAAAQGQSVFVATGDGSATACYQNDVYGTEYGVNALGSSIYNVAVGGTMFVDYGPSQYWTAGSAFPAPATYNFTTATGYIPEAPWNEGFLTTTLLNPSSTATLIGDYTGGAAGGISIFNSRPSWQTGSGIPAADPTNCSQLNSAGTCYASGVSGTVAAPHRLVPDISSIASGLHDAAAFCGEGSCFDTSSNYAIGTIGGTSVASPMIAGVQALINQKNGGRQGNPNFHYYPLANADYLSGACQSVLGTATSVTVTLPSATCNFHDVVSGSNIAAQNATDTVGLGFFAAAGYDEASGLGSLNINNVATNWNTINLKATTTDFTLTPLTSTHGTSLAFSATVSATAGTPTGTVILIPETATPGDSQGYFLANGATSGPITSLPGGTYFVHVHYAGDGTFASSDSAVKTVTITKEASKVSSTVYDYIPGQYFSGPSSIPYGAILEINTQATSGSGIGIPTGTMTYNLVDITTQSQLPSLTNTIDGAGYSAFISGGSYPSIPLSANYAALPVGTYAATAVYNGDNSFTSNVSYINFDVVQQTTGASTLVASATNITGGNSVTFTDTVPRMSGGIIASLAAFPSGTVTFLDVTTGVTLGTVPLNSIGVATLTTTAITSLGSNSIMATYNGDTNYSGVSSSATVSVGIYNVTSTTLSVATGTYYVGSSIPLTATVTPVRSASVSFYDGTIYLGSATSDPTTGIATLFTSALTAGSHTLKAIFAGTASSVTSSGTTTLSVLQNLTALYLETSNTGTATQALSIAARVTRNPNSGSVPAVPLTGTVTFFDGSTSIGTSTPVLIPGGYASYLATLSATLSRGVHTLTATYSGDANYAPAASASITATIGPNNVWVANVGTGNVTGLTSAGVSVATGTGGGTGLAIDNSGNIWSLNKTSLAEFSSTGTVINSGYTGAGISNPTSLAIDGAGMVWIANGNSTLSAFNSAGAAVSTSTGYPTTTSTPTSLNIDASGNLWITNSGDNSVTEVIGAAAPVMTPTIKAVTNDTLAVKP